MIIYDFWGRFRGAASPTGSVAENDPSSGTKGYNKEGFEALLEAVQVHGGEFEIVTDSAAKTGHRFIGLVFLAPKEGENLEAIKKHLKDMGVYERIYSSNDEVRFAIGYQFSDKFFSLMQDAIASENFTVDDLPLGENAMAELQKRVQGIQPARDLEMA